MESLRTTAASSDESIGSDQEQQQRPEVRFHLIRWGATRGNSGEKFWVGIKPDFIIDTAKREGFMKLLDNCFIIK